MYTLSFTFTNPNDSKDINYMNLKELDKMDIRAWITELIPIAISTKSWIISHLTIKKYTV